MNLDAIGISILLPALAAGLLVTATHVPLGMQVLARGIVFIDLAIAQIAGCGVLLADRFGFEAEGHRGADRGTRRGAGRRAAADVDRAGLARRAGSGDRRGVRARRDRQRAAAREQRARQRAPARSPGRPDPLGAAVASGLGGAGVRGDTGAVVRVRASGWGAPGFTCCSRSRSRCRCSWSACTWSSRRSIVPPLATRRMQRGRLAASWALGAAGYAAGPGRCRPRSTCRAARSSCGCWSPLGLALVMATAALSARRTGAGRR